MSSKMDKWDGFYIVPGEEDDSMQINFFTLKDHFEMGEPVENTELGNKYHVVLFKQAVSGEEIEMNDCFEAIFADPVTYAKGLLGSNLYGTFLKKTENSSDWFDDYLKKTLDSVKLVNMAMSIKES